MNSYFEYVPGRATQSYRAEVDEAAALAERQKGRVDPIHHERIDCLLDTFARKLADNINRRNEIAARVPSILIAGGSNFPVRKKEKQNRADAAAMEEYRQIRGLLDKIRGAGRGGISADDPAAVDKLKAKLAGLEAFQEKMKAVNAYYRKHGALEGCPQLSAVEIEELKAGMARSWRTQPRPYESYLLTNNNANIHRVKERIEGLGKRSETEFTGWAFGGGEVKINREANRLQVFFHEKPDRDTCSAMRHNGFKWAPSVGAWQRQLTDNAIYAAKHLDCLQPLPGEQPAPEQTEPVQEPAQLSDWRFYVIADLKTWADNAENPSPLEWFDSFEAAKARFEKLRSEPYNSEAVEPGLDGQPPARLTLGIESADGMAAADILHVRQGENYLVTDFTRSGQLRDDPQAMGILARISKEIGFDLVSVREQGGEGHQVLSTEPFVEWDNPYFPSATPGRIAARYYELMNLCHSFQWDEARRRSWIGEVVQRILREGEEGITHMTLFALGAVLGQSDMAPRKLFDELCQELDEYLEPGQAVVPKQRPLHRKSRER